MESMAEKQGEADWKGVLNAAGPDPRKHNSVNPGTIPISYSSAINSIFSELKRFSIIAYTGEPACETCRVDSC